jgi:hypothetical protein
MIYAENIGPAGIKEWRNIVWIENSRLAGCQKWQP